jgi:hypothetical protein
MVEIMRQTAKFNINLVLMGYLPEITTEFPIKLQGF